jgi:3-phenylpropionate/trans-cinnamate dioxygenase ferredoxin subunit
MMAVRVDVGAATDFPEGEARRVLVGDRPVAVVRIGEDLYAIGDTCTHANVSLSEGEVDVHERTLECWKHGSQFSLVDGRPCSLPATRPVEVFDVEVADGRVFVVAREA